MLRQTALLVGLMAAGCLAVGCVLGDGVDLPSTGIGPTDGGVTTDGGSEGSDGGLINGPPTDMPGAPAGDGGSPCCIPFSVGGWSGGGMGGAP